MGLAELFRNTDERQWKQRFHILLTWGRWKSIDQRVIWKKERKLLPEFSHLIDDKITGTTYRLFTCDPGTLCPVRASTNVLDKMNHFVAIGRGNGICFVVFFLLRGLWFFPPFGFLEERRKQWQKIYSSSMLKFPRLLIGTTPPNSVDIKRSFAERMRVALDSIQIGGIRIQARRRYTWRHSEQNGYFST